MTTRSREQPLFGQQLLRLRQRSGLTQAQLAERAGLSTAIVAALEQGRRLDPRLSTVCNLAAALGVPAAELVVGADG